MTTTAVSQATVVPQSASAALAEPNACSKPPTAIARYGDRREDLSARLDQLREPATA